MKHQEPLAKMADMWRERCLKAERERDLARRDYELMNKFREHAEAQRDQLREALKKIDADLDGRNFLENSSLRDTARTALNATE